MFDSEVVGVVAGVVTIGAVVADDGVGTVVVVDGGAVVEVEIAGGLDAGTFVEDSLGQSAPALPAATITTAPTNPATI